MEFCAGSGLRQDLLERVDGFEDVAADVAPDLRPNILIGGLLRWADDLSGARKRFEPEYDKAKQGGADNELPFLLWQLTELEV